jgi:hypothetical protein
MKQSLRRTLAPLSLSYGEGEISQGLLGRRFALDVVGSDLTLRIDLTPNFQMRNQEAPAYVEAAALTRRYARLQSLTCDDNLVRTRLVRAWKSLHEPQLRVVLDLGPRGHLTFAVRPHLLFAGGLQLQVLEVLEAVAPSEGAAQAA